MNEEDGKKLIAGMDAKRDLGAKLEAIDTENDSNASERELEIMDLMKTYSMAIGPLRKKLATGDSGSET